jgi:glyoxylase-like metal-dependent hydrolase (beta-lactamase superfamily II)
MVDQVKDSTWLVHEKELAAIENPPADMDGQQKSFLAAFRKVEKRDVFTGEKDVFGDGTVVIFETPGHTPGHMSLQLKLPETGYVLLTGDLWHRTESRQRARVPRFNFNEDTTRSSMTAFDERAKRLNAKVIIQHEPADITPLGGMIR